MMQVTSRLWLVLLLLSMGGCKASRVDPDAGPEEQLDIELAPDQALADLLQPDLVDQTSYMVAAVQYSSGDYTAVSGCGNDVCGLSHFVKEARKQGAELVVLPEYSVDQSTAELAPRVGDNPATDSRWKDGGIIKSFARLAVEQKLIISFNLIAQEGSELFNSQLAVGTDGKLLARHFKYQLFGSETKQLTSGTSIEESFFQTPAGRTGMLICADAQCVVTNLAVTPDCSAASSALTKEYFSPAKKADLILFSAFWTVGGTGIWAALNVQKKVATYGNAYLAAANNTGGNGRGGGIYEPTGVPIVRDSSGTPMVLVAKIPRK